MALDILNGVVSPITGLTWEGEQVHHYQAVIPVISTGESLDLGIGDINDIVIFRTSTSDTDRFEIELGYANEASTQLRVTPYQGFSNIKADYKYGTVTGVIDTSISDIIDIDSSGTILELTNIEITRNDSSVVSIEDNSIDFGNSSSENIFLVGAYINGVSQVLYSKNNSSLIYNYLDNKGVFHISDQQGSATFYDVFIQVQFTKSI